MYTSVVLVVQSVAYDSMRHRPLEKSVRVYDLRPRESVDGAESPWNFHRLAGSSGVQGYHCPKP